MKLHDYQKYAVRFIEEHPIAALFLDMGLGKTITTLTAIHNLMFDLFVVRRVLMIAPLRVARDTWSAEIEKWEHLKPLRYSVVVGTVEERLSALKVPADLYIINRENIDWLVNNTKFNYDMVVIDELSSFKSHQSKRFKALMKVRPNVKRIVGLTGTPASNGLMDLFAEFRLLDMGQRLGRFIGQYRNEYFKPDKQNGYLVYSYKPLPDAEERIYDKISDITVSMKAIDHFAYAGITFQRISRAAVRHGARNLQTVQVRIDSGDAGHRDNSGECCKSIQQTFPAGEWCGV